MPVAQHSCCCLRNRQHGPANVPFNTSVKIAYLHLWRSKAEPPSWAMYSASSHRLRAQLNACLVRVACRGHSMPDATVGPSSSSIAYLRSPNRQLLGCRSRCHGRPAAPPPLPAGPPPPPPPPPARPTRAPGGRPPSSTSACSRCCRSHQSSVADTSCRYKVWAALVVQAVCGGQQGQQQEEPSLPG